jgi:type II secretory pathway component PulJ
MYRNGFTLFELMVATVVTLMVVGVLFLMVTLLKVIWVEAW